MTETIRCPGCSTQFLLRPERVHEAIRRARCCQCGTVFAIAEEVARLLPPPPLPTGIPDILPESVWTEPAAPAPPVEPEPAPAVAAGPGPEPGPESEPEPEPAPHPAPAPILEGDDPFAAFDPPPSLTLGDLDGAEEEILEKTLVILPEPEEAAAPAEFPAATSTASGYSSARDAIAKLMGDGPPMAAPPERRLSGARNPMDVEATLSALDSTLSGPPPSPAPQAPADAGASTLKLSAQEIKAAMAAFSAPQPNAPLGAPPLPGQPPAAQATVPMEVGAQGPDLLKIQVEKETLNNATVEQVTAWIEEGRVQEYHMVARQFSDNWIEAVKVPALRPVFERRRREEPGRPAELPPPPPDPVPPKRSLFGGLFGRN